MLMVRICSQDSIFGQTTTNNNIFFSFLYVSLLYLGYIHLPTNNMKEANDIYPNKGFKPIKILNTFTILRKTSIF